MFVIRTPNGNEEIFTEQEFELLVMCVKLGLNSTNPLIDKMVELLPKG